MAIASDVFSHSTPTVFSDEAPANSTSIGERLLDRGLDIADAIVKAKYGANAAIPTSPDPRTAAGRAALLAQQQAAAGSSLNIGLVVVLLLVVFLISRR